MDEVDGMSSGDRGGMAELISLIKKSKVSEKKKKVMFFFKSFLAKIPVICICNDRGSSKVRSLASHCLELRFQKYFFFFN